MVLTSVDIQAIISFNTVHHFRNFFTQYENKYPVYNHKIRKYITCPSMSLHRMQ